MAPCGRSSGQKTLLQDSITEKFGQRYRRYRQTPFRCLHTKDQQGTASGLTNPLSPLGTSASHGDRNTHCFLELLLEQQSARSAGEAGCVSFF